jgi:RNA polymerase sigma-70 factor (ECF subfamily)
MHSEETSIEQWIGRLNAGDISAVERVFSAYEPYLRIVIRRQLSRRLRVKVDSQDIVQSVFADMVSGVRKGTWRTANRGQLLALLRQIARRRIADRYQQHRRSIERELPLDDASPGSLPTSSEPRASEVARGNELWDRMMLACPADHHEIVKLRLHGLRIGEIAERTGLHEGSVRRILYELARRLSVSQRGEAAATDDARGEQVEV